MTWHPQHDAVAVDGAADADTGPDAAARAARSEARAHVARVLYRVLDARNILDRTAAKWMGVKRQVVTQMTRPGGTKNLGVAEASLIRDDEARRELAQTLAGAVWRVVRAPIAGAPLAANVAIAGRLIRAHAHLVETYLAAHEDGVLSPAERRHLRELIRILVDDLLGLDTTLAADELPGERR